MMTDKEIAEHAATAALAGFDAFNVMFRSITRRAQQRFECQDWNGGRRDATERQAAYDQALEDVAVALEAALGERSRQRGVWRAAKDSFALLVAGRYDIERAETFFNSVTRRMLKTVGVDRDVEFFYLHPKPALPKTAEVVFRTYVQDDNTISLVKNLLLDLPFTSRFEEIDRDAALIAQEIDLNLWPIVGVDGRYTVDVVRAVFYRNREAYVIGRISVDGRTIPLIIPLTNANTGIRAETVLLHEAEASIVFSFAYSYFFVDVERYDSLIEFLHTIVPQAELAELYTSLGYNRHGKTEFYRDLHRFVHVSREQFVIAPGLEGAVMIAFTLPNYGFVFKVIKDRPRFLRSLNDTPKMITPEKVRAQYDFVSRRDPAGRMVDTEEFENLRFKTRRFSGPLLAEFALAAGKTAMITDEYVIIRHLYVQRKVVPLPMYFRLERDPEALRRVLIDFGYFLKDIAASGVFPCDLFNTWNYGVTHWGRVVLYDYDDVLPIERVKFRKKPAPRDEFEETEPEENWIVATEEDFFMDEIDRFSGIPKPLKGVFRSVHGDLYTLEFWNALTERLERGEVFDVIPYDRSKRFRHRLAAETL